MCEWFTTPSPNYYMQLPEIVEKSIKNFRQVLVKKQKNKKNQANTGSLMWKIEKFKNMKSLKPNNKNQAVSEYVWMIYNTISEFLHSTTSNRKKINKISDKFFYKN